ncbi:GntR family transcriptional regulator [Rhizobium miluonense]|uniref:GntR family transcriptional regulator n=1 Tax=Rhizobium miluonense TaxID=411945 RepID=A0A1C3V7B5_9HYPH|nr:GntR family transcriptional regulator [Rhizobium miluonense]SCB23571.1 GntR family transcriptional regulator [Rhizobium miluonense]
MLVGAGRMRIVRRQRPRRLLKIARVPAAGGQGGKETLGAMQLNSKAGWLTPIDPDLGNPTLQAYGSMLSALQDGRFRPESKLPSERTLSGALGVSRTTIRQVLASLARKGMLYTLPNRGWFVSLRTYSEGQNILRSFSLEVLEKGLKPTSRTLVQRVRPATLDEAETLCIPPTAPIIELRRLRGMDNILVGLTIAHLPEQIVPGLETIDLTDKSLFETLRERFNVFPTRCDYQLRADSADDETAELLGIQPGSPVLIGAEITYDQHERPILTGQTIYRGNAYRFRTSLYISESSRPPRGGVD